MFKKYIRKIVEKVLENQWMYYVTDNLKGSIMGNAKQLQNDEIISDISNIIFNGFVERETCWCLLQKENTVKGEPIIKKGKDKYCCDELYLYTPYYCKTHAPKDKKLT